MPGFRTGHPRAHLIRTTNQTLAAGANDVVFEAADYDDVAGWNGTSGYVLDRDGLWLLIAAANRAAVGTSSSLITRLRVNGLTVIQTTGAPTVNALQAQCSGIFQLLAGDVVGMNVTGHGTASSTLTAGNTGLFVVRIGPKSWR